MKNAVVDQGGVMRVVSVVPLVAAFVGNASWFGALLTIHVIGAVAGIGPTFAYSIIGPMAQKAGPNGGVQLMESIEKIERAMVTPVYFLIQPLTGILLIFNRGLNRDFFSSSRSWLLAALGIYVVIGFISYGINNPALAKMIHLAKDGQAMTAEFQGLAKKVKSLGPVLTLMTTAIIVLMVWKPGSGCGGLYRC